MPGFTIAGSNDANNNKNNKAEMRRKHRWRFTSGHLARGEWVYLQKAARPALDREEVVIHHDQEEAYLAGKQKWEPITLEFYDALNPDITTRLYEWIAGATGVGNINNATVSHPSTYKQEVKLEMTDGQGSPIDSWTLYGAWPKSTNWNDLTYEDTGIQLVTVVLRFDRAIKTSSPSSSAAAAGAAAAGAVAGGAAGGLV